MEVKRWMFFKNEHNADLAAANMERYREDYPDYEFKAGQPKGQFAQPGFESKVGIYRRKKGGNREPI